MNFKLEDIGFYTLSDERVKQVSVSSPLWRCEILVTDICNLSCPYCRGMASHLQGDMDVACAIQILHMWIEYGLRNVRFSGGEPCLYQCLPQLIALCKVSNVERIAVSTNGTMDLDYYLELFSLGVNDFSISLDSGCCSIGEQMMGGVSGWDQVVNNIRALSQLTYVTAGMVFTEDNINEAVESVKFASSLGVADIRVIPSAQYNEALKRLTQLPESILDKHPILKYRINNIRKERHVRGIDKDDSHKCGLVLDDMAVVQNYHYPCIIYLREGGDPIGKINENIRQARHEWFLNHNSYNDPICRRNCLDVCVDFNNKFRQLNENYK